MTSNTPNTKVGFINSNGIVEDYKLKIWRTNSENSAYDELETMVFFFLCETDSFYFFIDDINEKLYVTSKKDASAGNRLIFGKSTNKTKGSIIDELTRTRFSDPEYKQFLKESYHSFLLIRDTADMQFGNTMVFRILYGCYNNSRGELRSDSMVSDLLYTCVGSDVNKWISRERKLSKLLNGKQDK